MKKDKTEIKVVLPKNTLCAIVNFVYYDIETGAQLMGSMSLDSERIAAGVAEYKQGE